MTNENKPNENKTTRKNNTGGNVLASGGFGCVFSPALKCEGEKHREKNKVSKLMTERHAIKEYEEINIFKEKLDTIPDYKDYYLIYDTTLCRPAKMTATDLSNYSKKCSALSKINITKQNINDNNDKLMLLNMPKGGLAVDDYIYQNGSFKKLYILHKRLIQLFKNGVIPMNSKNIFHSDIKDSNVLVDESAPELKTRLIDWGLSTEYKPFHDEPFPIVWRNRPFQFNVPFSVIIFTDYFIEKYSEFIKNDGRYKDEEYLKPFVLDYITSWMNERGAGHYKFINEIMYILFSKSLVDVPLNSKPKVIETEFTMPYIINYIVRILIKYTKFRKNGNVHLRKYLDNVFIKNVDVWGFISVYFPMLELLYDNYNKLSDKERELFEVLKNIFINLYSTSDEAINKNELLTKFNEMERIIYHINLNFSKKDKRHNVTKYSKDKGSGIKTRKYKKKSKVSFKRRPKQKRFKKPVFLLIRQ
jgi:serine/threonine protein kinase